MSVMFKNTSCLKIPRFAFEKFPQADPTLTTQMKSVGEAMAIGRTFKESLQKCLRLQAALNPSAVSRFPCSATGAFLTATGRLRVEIAGIKVTVHCSTTQVLLERVKV